MILHTADSRKATKKDESKLSTVRMTARQNKGREGKSWGNNKIRVTMPMRVVSKPCHSGLVTHQTNRQRKVDKCAHLQFHGLAILAMAVEQVQHDRKASTQC